MKRQYELWNQGSPWLLEYPKKPAEILEGKPTPLSGVPVKAEVKEQTQCKY